MVLDIGLPDADGRDVCQALRARGVMAPVLFLTARDGLSDLISGFHAGADDYLTKPFALAELLARIGVLARRAANQTPEAPGPGLLLDPGTHGLLGADGTTPLTPTEFRLLAELAAHSGSVVRRAALIQAGWPDGAIVSDNTLDAYVSTSAGQATPGRPRAGDRQRARRRLRAAMSVRVRLLLVSLATLAVGLGALLLIGNVLFARTVRSQTSQLLRSRVEAQVAALSVTATGIRVRDAPNDDALDSHAWILSGRSVVERPRDVPTASRSVRRAAWPPCGGAMRSSGPANTDLLVRPLTAPGSHRAVGAVVVVVDASPFDQLQRKVLVGSLAFALLVLAAGGLAIWRALTGALDPVRRMTEDAEDWGTHDLDRRFALGSGDDELTGLGRTLDHLLERIASSRRHEQRFAGDVAHELRTPLAAIRGRAELALTAAEPNGDRERRGCADRDPGPDGADEQDGRDADRRRAQRDRPAGRNRRPGRGGGRIRRGRGPRAHAVSDGGR